MVGLLGEGVNRKEGKANGIEISMGEKKVGTEEIVRTD